MSIIGTLELLQQSIRILEALALIVKRAERGRIRTSDAVSRIAAFSSELP